MNVRQGVEVRRLFEPGQSWDVENHYITRVDHPCFGTTRRVVEAVNTSGLRFAPLGDARAETLKWPRSAELVEVGGVVSWSGHPAPGMLFLSLVKVA